MKRVALMALTVALLSTPAYAITEFNKQWKGKYLGDDTPGDFLTAGRKAGCNVCHVKGEDKKEVRNEYGAAVMKFLKAEDFPKDRIKEEPEKVKEEILAGFMKAGEMKSKDGKSFADKIKAGELPATDAGL